MHNLSESPNGVVLLGDSSIQANTTLRLMRMVEWAGYRLSDFDLLRMDDDDWVHTLTSRHPRVVVPLGNIAADLMLRRTGSILINRGYVYSGDSYYIIPTVHPLFVQRGQAKWTAAAINDIRKAVHIATNGMPLEIPSYELDPLPSGAYQWAMDFCDAAERDRSIRLAFDIETPGKGEDEDDVDLGDAPDRTWNIERIGFSYKPLTGLSIPWAPPYMGAIRMLMESNCEKVVWNAGFDVPRIRRSGVGVHGLVHDGMVAWHILHSDLPKRLGFVATFTCPWQPAWKHLSGARPAFYNATDADVELRSMIAIEHELRASQLWDVYQRDVIDLDPVLVHMSTRGMPIDADIRYDRAVKLAKRIAEVAATMEASIPIGARTIDHVYKTTPQSTDGLFTRPGHRSETYCTNCGLAKPTKPHFRRLKKKSNPCVDGTVGNRDVSCTEYYRLKRWTPSRDQMTKYHQIMNRPLPMVYDKKERKRKVSFGEEQLKGLILRYPDDSLYKLILEYREADKLAGTYVGRPLD